MLQRGAPAQAAGDLAQYARVLDQLGRHDEAKAIAKRAIELLAEANLDPAAEMPDFVNRFSNIESEE